MLPVLLVFGVLVGVGLGITQRWGVLGWGLIVAVAYWDGLLLVLGDRSEGALRLIVFGGLVAAANYAVGVVVGLLVGTVVRLVMDRRGRRHAVLPEEGDMP